MCPGVPFARISCRGEACKVPLISAGVPLSTRQDSLNIPPAFLALACVKLVVCKHFATGLVRRKRVRFPDFCWVPWFWPASRCIFCKYFATGREEVCRVPPISAGPPSPRVRNPSIFKRAPGFGMCPGVFFACTPPLVGGKRVYRVPPLSAGAPASCVRGCFQVRYLPGFRCWAGGSV